MTWWFLVIQTLSSDRVTGGGGVVSRDYRAGGDGDGMVRYGMA